MNLFKDITSDKNTNRYSLVKVLQFIAGITGTIVVLYMTYLQKITFDIFGVYLFAMGLSHGASRWIDYKNKLANKTETKETKTETKKDESYDDYLKKKGEVAND